MSALSFPPVILSRAGTREGSYRLERRLGAGGMGEVWLGHHVISQGVAAVKMLSAKLAGRADAKSLFAREQNAVLRLAHPHVVPVFEVGASHIAMAYVDGTSFARRLRGGVTPALAFRVARQIASALAHAHQRGVLHLDVKPSNILMDTAGNAFLADFGAAFFLEDAAPDAQPVAGTVAYIAPERAAGEAFDASADQFALGRTLLAALLGTETLPAWGREMGALPASLPDEVRAIVGRATAVDPRERFPDLAAFEAALAACDVEGYRPNVAPLSPLREDARHLWSEAGSAMTTVAPEIARMDYTLDALEAQRALSPEALSRFREITGLRSTGFSLYGHTQSLGARTSGGWIARARHLVVLAPGYAMDRGAWSEMAAALVRDNPDSLVATLDHSGFGEAVFAEEPVPRKHLGYLAAARTMLAWTDLLGIDTLPTVFLGHSLSGTGLMAIPDEAFGPHRARILLTPMFRALALSPWKRALARFAAFALSWLFRPRALYEAALAYVIDHEPLAESLGATRRASMVEEAKGLSVTTHARLAAAAFDLDPPPGEGLVRAWFVLGLNDPESRAETCERAFRMLKMRPERVRWLASGYHYPHLDNVEDPAGTARNRHELVMLVDEALDEVSPTRAQSTDLARTEISSD